MRVTFFEHAIEMAKALEDDIRASDAELDAAFGAVNIGEEVVRESELRRTVAQLHRGEAICEYVSQALKQQLTDVAEKIAQAQKLRDSIDSILQRKGNARMDLERKIMKAGKRASESAVQRAFQRHIEDMKEEQPLQDQKKDSETELTERVRYESTLKEELGELEEVRQKLCDAREVLHECVQSEAQSGNRATADDAEAVAAAAAAAATMEDAQARVELLLAITARKRVEWAKRRGDWATVKGVRSHPNLPSLCPTAVCSLPLLRICPDACGKRGSRVKLPLVLSNTAGAGTPPSGCNGAG